MMMKHHSQQQQQQHSMNGGHGGPSPTETKWWYKGPDGETYGPYTPREMMTWGNSGYFNDTLPVKTEKDEMFHSIGDWTTVMGGANPFGSGSVPAFNVLMHGAHTQQFLMYPPGLPAPAPFASGVAPPSGRGGPDGRFGGPQQGGPQPFVPNGGPPPTAAMASLHLGGGGGHMGMHHMHHGGPLSQPPSEPNDGANSSNSHTPDSAEPDFRALHQMGGGGMPPPVPTMHAGRMQFGYGMAAAAMAQHQQSLAAAAAAQAAAAQQTHASNGQLQYSRVTTTQDAPWNSRRDIAIDASQRAAPRSTIATQTLPVIIGSKDASRLLSELTGCQIVIT
ncbi:hypothetical protein PENTCL1PPCAC_2937 [Pristionchus entomophagus]|uniref:GYF domain-containing protein n=1 Tax=Pristionchus entomophagus TaxID=358040 RepID=A0AAV5SDY6_9BILA|nr:hypothetical protein PENTCL1PPCAC_2937 [Pristionchus entomophagus]